MLVIISDLHLTDGTTGSTVAADAFRKFRESLRTLAYDASWRTGGAYRPIETIDLVLLGDILDLIRTTRWSEGAARPWDDIASPALAEKVGAITDVILDHNEESLGVLRAMSQGGALTLPPADAQGQPALTAAAGDWLPVTVNIHYVAGNHDWFLHLPGDVYEAIRQRVTAAIGLANPPGIFAHDPAESALLGEIYGRHRLFARHGDIYDPFNFDKEKGRDAATLGDAIVVELINRFPFEVQRQMGDALPPAFVAGLAELSNVRPSLLVPVWINGLITRTELSRSTGNEVKKVWNQIAEEVLELPFVREHDTRSPFDTVDLLETTLRFSRVLSFHSIAELVSWIRQRLWGGDVSFAKNAFEEDAFKNRTASFFVYGHTHHFELVPLEATMEGGQVFEQIYMNSGTWHPLHEATLHDPRRQSFIQYKTMTYLAFYQGDERKGRHYETWTGTLDD